MREGSVALRDALRGISLSSILPGPEGFEEYFTLDSSGALTDEGTLTEILDEASRRGGFAWRSTYGFFTPPKTGDNFTWTDCLVWSAGAYDISVVEFSETVQRKEKGAFLCVCVLGGGGYGYVYTL